MTSEYIGYQTFERRSPSFAVLDALRRIVQVLRESSRRAELSAGISGAQLFVLEAINERPGCCINELSARTRTHQSSVSTVVSRLVERRLVRRRRAAADSRRLELVLTPLGRRALTTAPDAVQGQLIRTIERLPKASQQRLAHLLARILQGIDRTTRTPRMFFDDSGQIVRA